MMKTNIATGITIGTRTLTAGFCGGCQLKIGTVQNGVAVDGQFLAAGQEVRCQDCRDRDSRAANGWTPENSCN